jgi:hypothetical protein
MKRKITVILILIVLALISVTPVIAGGDQVRGEKGAGFVKQEQVVPPPVAFPSP